MGYIKIYFLNLIFLFENQESAAALFHASYRTHLLRRDVRRKLDPFFSVKMCIQITYPLKNIEWLSTWAFSMLLVEFQDFIKRSKIFFVAAFIEG